MPARVGLENQEMCGEPFDAPAPETLIFGGWFAVGEGLRSGCARRRGNERVHYAQPGHETNPTCHHPDVQAPACRHLDVQKILVNAANCAAQVTVAPHSFRRVEPAEQR